MKRLSGILALLFACATACAGPSYHVVVDTQAYAGQSGYLDFLILGQAAASPIHATLTGFSGIADDGGGAPIFLGDVGGSGTTGVVLGNAEGWNEFGQWTRFGGHIAFDVRLDVDPQPGAGSTLEVALLDRDLNYLRATGTAAYGFSPFRATPADVLDAGAHNADERVHVDDLLLATRFHLALARRLLG